MWVRKSRKQSSKNIWNFTTCTCENGKKMENIIEDWVVTCDGVIEVAKTGPTRSFPTKNIPTNFSKKKVYL